MTQDSFPYPESLMGYIQRIFQLIEEARHGALERHDAEFGDDAQVLGIRAYKNFVAAVQSLKGTPGWEWLQCEEPRGRLTLQIEDERHGRIILRVWRADDPEQDAEEKRMMVARESLSMLELFPTPEGTIDRWGLVYQTDEKRLADTAYLIGYSSATGRALVQYEVPGETIAGTASDLGTLPEAEQIESPKPRLKKKLSDSKASS